jgi:hypothetical protein
MTTPTLRRGGAGAQEAADAAVGSKFPKVPYFSLEENKSTVLRFLTDSPDWIYVKQHTAVPTKNKPAEFTGNWPTSMPAVCRHDEAFQGIYADCYICDLPVMNPHDANKPLKPAVRVWALAVEREPVVENGVTLGYRNVMVDVDVKDEKGESTGKTEKQIKIVLVNMGMKNFFSGLQGIYGLLQPNSVCTRDMVIKRTGSGINTDYQIIPLDPIPDHVPGSDSWKKYEDAIVAQGIDLEKIVAERASDEYYARFFDPTKTAPAQNSGGSAGTGTEAKAEPATSNDVVDQDRLAAMAARVTGTGSNAAAAATETPAATESAPATPTGPKNFD